MNCKMTIYFGEILFWVSMGMYINHFHLGGMSVRFLDFGVPNMFLKLFPYSNHSNNPFYCEARLVS